MVHPKVRTTNHFVRDCAELVLINGVSHVFKLKKLLTVKLRAFCKPSRTQTKAHLLQFMSFYD